MPGDRGAVCDYFLKDKQEILDAAAWAALQLQWNAEGDAVACTRSSTVGNLKAELEKLCTKTPCTYNEAEAIKKAAAAMGKMADYAKIL